MSGTVTTVHASLFRDYALSPTLGIDLQTAVANATAIAATAATDAGLAASAAASAATALAAVNASVVSGNTSITASLAAAQTALNASSASASASLGTASSAASASLGTASAAASASLGTASAAASASLTAYAAAHIYKDVKDYGAVGDGVHIDTAAIQAAFNAGVGTLPKGTFLIDASLVVPANLTVQGAGQGATVIMQSNLALNAFNCPNRQSRITGLTIDFNGVPTAGSAIYVTGAFATLDNFWINQAFVGVEVTATVGLYMHHFGIRSFVSIGVWAHSMNDAYLGDFIIDANGSSGSFGGIRLTDFCEAFTACNGDVLNGQYNITTDTSNYVIGARPAYAYFSNVYFDSGKVGGGLFNRSVEFNFTNCWFSAGRTGAGFPGALIGPTQGFRFVNCTFFNCGSAGVRVANSAVDTNFIGCAFESNSVTSGVNASNGIEVLAGTSRFKIIGCSSGNGVYYGTQNAGIFIDTGCSKFVVTGNDVSASTIPMLLGVTTLGVIRDNIGLNPVGGASVAVGASPWTYTATPYSETLYVNGGTVTSIAIDGNVLFTGTGHTVGLGPNQHVTVTYSAIPTVYAMRY